VEHRLERRFGSLVEDHGRSLVEIENTSVFANYSAEVIATPQHTHRYLSVCGDGHPGDTSRSPITKERMETFVTPVVTFLPTQRKTR
jgi:hypothetical protein